MTTNKVSFISMMFVVGIIYLCALLIINFSILDLTYLIMLIICFIKFLIIRKLKNNWLLTISCFYIKK